MITKNNILIAECVTQISQDHTDRVDHTDHPDCETLILQNLSDSELYRRCKIFGSNARLWMRKFEALLPEVFRRRLYKRRGFASIHEFGAKLAGMSHKKVDRILQLSQKLSDKPALKEVFESGEVGFSKVARVAYIATPETDKKWAEKVKRNSLHSLDLSVKETRENKSTKSVLEHTFSQLSFSVSQSCERKFRALKQKFEKQTGEAMSYGEVLMKLMKMVEKDEKIQQKKTIIQVCPDCATKKAKEANSRNVPTAIKRLVLARQNERCAKSGCLHPPTQLHYKKGYALIKAIGTTDGTNDSPTGGVPDGANSKIIPHSPENLEYLCVSHPKLAHADHEYVQQYRRE